MSMKTSLIIAPALAAALLAGSPKISPKQVTYFDSDRVAAAFVKGMPLIEVENYKVHASHREGSGMVEIHERDTDIVYVLEGSATLILGGGIVEGKTTATEEIRGASIRGGETRHIVKGDVIIIPNGVPHWFKEVPGPINYYVVKVRSEQ
jgi:mannose-6-phosphate isomerase-like protein (cupin superfamily)